MSNQATDRALWRGALIPSFALSLIAVTAFGFIQGKDGLWGALLGSFTVIIFFSVHLIINTISKNLDPIATMALAMFSYFAKVAIMGAFLILITKTTTPESVNRPGFAVTALAITAAWLAGEIRAFTRLRIHLPLPGSLPQTGGTQPKEND